MHSGPIYINYVKAKNIGATNIWRSTSSSRWATERTYSPVAVFDVQYYHPFNDMYIAYYIKTPLIWFSVGTSGVLLWTQ